MKLPLWKPIIGKVAAYLAARKAKKAQKKAKKEARKAFRRTVKTILLMTLSFCTGAGLVAWLVYAHREELATAVYGDMLKTRFCPCRILKRLFRKQA